MSFAPKPVYTGALREIVQHLNMFDVKPTKSIAKALALSDALPPAEALVPDLLSLDDAGLKAYVEEVALRDASSRYHGDTAHRSAIDRVNDQIAEAAAQALASGEAGELIEALRPAFDEQAKIIERAARLGILNTSNETAVRVLESGNPEMVTAWQPLAEALDRIEDVAFVRRRLSELLNLSPTPAEIHRLNGVHYGPDFVGDWSVAFAKGDGWTSDGSLNLRREPGRELDWLRVGVVGLHLSSPAEAATKISTRLTKSAPAQPLVDRMPVKESRR